MEHHAISAGAGGKKWYPTFLFVLWGAVFLFSAAVKGQGNLLLYPKRIVFEGAKKSQTLNLANSGRDTVRYLISVVQLRMKQDGSFETITEPDSGQQFASNYFRIFPRSVVLGPNEAQSVKLQLVNTGDLKGGEYRSHIYLRAEGAKKPLGEEASAHDSGAISVKLVAVFGISLPVIIRVGESTGRVSLSNAVFEMRGDSVPSLGLTFRRTGNTSLYGDVAVDHISSGGKVSRVATAKGMAVYTPNGVREFTLVLDKSAGINYHSGKLRIAYTAQADEKSTPLAQTELRLQ